MLEFCGVILTDDVVHRAMIDPAYKVVALMWAKDLAETAIFAAIAYPVLRRMVKSYFASLACPHCGKKFREEKTTP